MDQAYPIGNICHVYSAKYLLATSIEQIGTHFVNYTFFSIRSLSFGLSPFPTICQRFHKSLEFQAKQN